MYGSETQLKANKFSAQILGWYVNLTTENTIIRHFIYVS